eukprot:TRINITY_DN2261_c0_g1_i2.p1 TRINITY_DN2261_c0_g1~~TRINITY_DN2261_c0_g1_i2.p1  ORF type:complete len:913 (-),score=243.03 TRINITY_DN2261_c0_g1_i2:541-3279(-)
MHEDQWQDFSVATPWEHLQLQVEKVLGKWESELEHLRNASRLRASNNFQHSIIHDGEQYMISLTYVLDQINSEGRKDEEDSGWKSMLGDHPVEFVPFVDHFLGFDFSDPNIEEISPIQRKFGCKKFVVFSQRGRNFSIHECPSYLSLLVLAASSVQRRSTVTSSVLDGIACFVPTDDPHRGRTLYEGMCLMDHREKSSVHERPLKRQRARTYKCQYQNQSKLYDSRTLDDSQSVIEYWMEEFHKKLGLGTSFGTSSMIVQGRMEYKRSFDFFGEDTDPIQSVNVVFIHPNVIMKGEAHSFKWKDAPECQVSCNFESGPSYLYSKGIPEVFRSIAKLISAMYPSAAENARTLRRFPAYALGEFPYNTLNIPDDVMDVFDGDFERYVDTSGSEKLSSEFDVVGFAPPKSLLWNMVDIILITSVGSHFEEFVEHILMELRNHFIHPKLIHSLPLEVDWGCSILHQKLSFMNTCIKFILDSESSRSFDVGDDDGFSTANDGWELDLAFDDPTEEMEAEEIGKKKYQETESDHFESIDEDVENDQQRDQDLEMSSDMMSSGSSSEEFFDVLDEEDTYASERKGAKCPLIRGSSTLQSLGSNDDMILFVPHTQEHVRKTSDRIMEEQAGIAHREEADDQSKGFLQEGMEPYLVADMMAFKAANPSCVLEDFIRWYSPVDFQDGKLSSRMEKDDNAWKRLWNSSMCQPFPASEQVPLFDARKEGERTLMELQKLGWDDWKQEIVKQACFMGYFVLCSTVTSTIQPVREGIESLRSMLLSMQGKKDETNLISLADQFWRNMLKVSYIQRCVDSLVDKFGDGVALVEKCLKSLDSSSGQYFDASGKQERKTIHRFIEPRIQSRPENEEYTLVCRCARPFACSGKSVQRMHVSIQPDGEVLVSSSISSELSIPTSAMKSDKV